MKRIINLIVSFVIVLSFAACSTLNGEEQFTNKSIAPSLVSELYGSVNQTLTINHEEDSHISWIGFIQSNDFKYFKITKVQVGDEVIVEDGEEIDGVEYTASSTSVVENISVSSSESANNEYENGTINVAGETDLKITVEYSPLVAIDSDTDPHEAYLIVYYDAPTQGAMRIKLNGYTQGVKDSKCTQDVSSMEEIEYEFVESQFDLYFCSAQVADKGQNNDSEHGASTNLATIPVDGTLKAYQADDETVCLVSEPEPSIPDFVLPIPEGLAPIDSMDISMVEGSSAECTVDESGNFTCDGNVELDVLVATSPMTVTNQTVSAETLQTSDCPDFGEISGSGAYGDDEVTLIVYGTVLSDANTEEYGIVDALIVGVLKLQKK